MIDDPTAEPSDDQAFRRQGDQAQVAANILRVELLQAIQGIRGERDAAVAVKDDDYARVLREYLLYAGELLSRIKRLIDDYDPDDTNAEARALDEIARIRATQLEIIGG